MNKGPAVSNRFRPSIALGTAGLLLFANACMVGPTYQRPGAPAPVAFKEAPPAGWKEAQPNDGALRGKWWEIYSDPRLNALEDQVSISNQNVLAAELSSKRPKRPCASPGLVSFPP